jgi:hypothetical protein
MEEVLARAAADNPGLPTLRPLLAQLYCEIGKKDRAGELLGMDATANFADIPYDFLWPVHPGDLCRGERSCG